MRLAQRTYQWHPGRHRGLIGNHGGIGAAITGEKDVKPRIDKISVRLVLSKDNGLAQPLTVVHPVAVLHQCGQRLINRIRVEKKAVQGLSRHFIRGFIAPVRSVPLLLLLGGELIVADTFAHKLSAHTHAAGRHQEAVCHCLFQRVGIGGHTRFKVKEAVGVEVHLILGGGGQAQEQGVKILKDFLVLGIDRAVRLVHHNQVKIARPKLAQGQPGIVHGAVNDVEHGGVSGRIHPPGGVLLGH